MDRDQDFDAFVRSFSPRLLRAAFLLTGDPGHAEDLAQATLMRIYTAWDRVAAAESPYAYSQRVLLSVYLRGRRRPRPAETLGHAVDDVAPIDDRVDDRDQLRRALAELPARMRAVVVLRFYEDMSVEQAAATLGISTGAVKSQSAKALARLRLSPNITTVDGA